MLAVLISFDQLGRTTDKGTIMNGAESLIGTLVASGIEVCFANPGTSEMHFVANVAVLITRGLPKGGKLDARAVIQVIAHYLPEGAIIADEAVSSGLPYINYTATCAPHDYLNLAGGAIGGMMPVGTGAAVACPDRKVVCLEGDGSAMYTPQALWTQARERLDVTTVIYANRSYAILNIELARVGIDNPGSRARSLFDLHDPTLDWVKLAEGMGVEAARAETTERFADLFSSAMKTRGPRLIEAVI
jgi:acetolactate synthase-1/2/3 large subunit